MDGNMAEFAPVAGATAFLAVHFWATLGDIRSQTVEPSSHFRLVIPDEGSCRRKTSVPENLWLFW
jgi:hypothetical protein